MIKSMTGYGKASAETDGKTISVEVRTSEFETVGYQCTDTPGISREGLEIRIAIGRVLERGKVDFNLTSDSDAEISGSSINKALARQYHREILELAEELKAPVGDDLISSILKMPDVCGR
jgi:uncharacterized protein YicC (UPF0701 family)